MSKRPVNVSASQIARNNSATRMVLNRRKSERFENITSHEMPDMPFVLYASVILISFIGGMFAYVGLN